MHSCNVNCTSTTCVESTIVLDQHNCAVNSQQTTIHLTEDTHFKNEEGVTDAVFETDSIDMELVEQSTKRLRISDTEVEFIDSDYDGEDFTKNVPVGLGIDETLANLNIKPIVPETLDDTQYYSCGFCLKKFTHQESLDSHVSNEHSRRLRCKYTCVICGVEFYSKLKLNNHVIKTHPKERWKLVPTCEKCGHNFTTNTQLTKHMICSHGHKPTGTEARKLRKGEASKAGSLIPHNTKVDPREYHQGFTTNGLNCYICGYCGKKSKHEKMIIYHINEIHVNKFKCEICGEFYLNKSKLSLHVIQKHPKETAKVVPNCANCGLNFLTPGSLKSHMRSCGKKHFECATCKRRFVRAEGLFQHTEHKHGN